MENLNFNCFCLVILASFLVGNVLRAQESKNVNNQITFARRVACHLGLIDITLMLSLVVVLFGLATLHISKL